MSDAPSTFEAWRICLALLAALSSVGLSYHFQLGVERQLVIAIGRSIAQLLLFGYVLLNFIFSVNTPFVVGCYIAAMLLIAAVEITNRQTRSYNGHYFDSVIACVIGGAFVGIYSSLVVFHPTPWWNPRVFIPTAGMIIGSSVSGPSVAVDRLLSDVTEKRHETEVRLAFGASGFESLLPPVRAAVMAALMPNLNQMSIVGIVAIPGMMTGQLLGGAEPLVAAENQMAILFLILAATCLSTYIAVVLAVRNAVMSPAHRLTPERVLKKSGPKLTIDAAIVAGLADLVRMLWDRLRRWLCCLAFCEPLCRDVVGPSDAVVADRTTYNALPQSTVELTTTISSDERFSLRTEGDEIEEALYKVEYTLVANSASLRANDLPLLEITGFNVLSGDKQLLPSSGLTFTIHAGQRVSIEGPSGIGKTRLLRALAQLEEPLTGSLQLHCSQSGGALTQEDANANSITTYGQDACHSEKMKGFDFAQIAVWRSKVIYIPQALPPLAGTPMEFLEEALQFKSRNAWAKPQDMQRSCDWVEKRLLLEKGKLSQAWAALSGGERQRAIIACGVLLACPAACAALSGGDGSSVASNSNTVAAVSGEASWSVLLLDEPTAACDAQACAAVEGLLIETGAACVIVTHDVRQSFRLANTRILLA